MKNIYRKRGIREVHEHSISDGFDEIPPDVDDEGQGLDDAIENEYCEQLLQVALFLNDLINKKNQTVFVHCTSGVSRSPTLIVVFLCMFIQVDDWYEPKKVESLI